MLRALSTRGRSRRGYEQLGDDEESTAAAALVPKLSRAKSLPAKFLSYSRKFTDATAAPAAKATPRGCDDLVKNASKVHPFFRLFDTRQRKKKKVTAMPEFSRYLQYVREGEAGGAWDDLKEDIPVVSCK